VTSKPFGLRYLGIFEDDLAAAVDYIAVKLKNPQAAAKLIDDLEEAVERRAVDPLGFAPYPSGTPRPKPYYALRVRNYIAFYVIEGRTIEFRRFLWSRRDITRLLEGLD
jgi:plasmid stabilization system protein ParE